MYRVKKGIWSRDEGKVIEDTSEGRQLFYRFPAINPRAGKSKQELQEDRCKQWLAAWNEQTLHQIRLNTFVFAADISYPVWFLFCKFLKNLFKVTVVTVREWLSEWSDKPVSIVLNFISLSRQLSRHTLELLAFSVPKSTHFLQLLQEQIIFPAFFNQQNVIETLEMASFQWLRDKKLRPSWNINKIWRYFWNRQFICMSGQLFESRQTI